MFSFPKTLDNTIVSGWQTCETKAFLSHFLHFRPRGPQVHLDAGAVYARGLEVYRKAYYSTNVPTQGKHEECMLLGIRAMIKMWGYDPEVDAVFAQSKKSFHRVLEMYVKYFKHFGVKTDEVTPLVIDGEAAVEKSFTLQLDIKNPDTGEPILYHGRFDFLAEYGGGIFLVDDKTCSQLGASWSGQWDFRSQFTGYVYGAKTFGLPVLGAIVRGACFYVDRVDFQQSITRRAQWELDKWFEDLHVSVDNMVRYYTYLRDVYSGMESPNGKPQHAVRLLRQIPQRGIFSNACNSYSGCEFQSLCKTQHPERYVSDFVIRVWDPTNPHQEE